MDSGTTANTQDSGDTAVAIGTDVNLIWGGADGVIGTGSDDVTYSTTTGTGGIFSFCGVVPDANGVGGDNQYQVVVPTSPGTPVTANVGGAALDSNGTQDGNASKAVSSPCLFQTGWWTMRPMNNDPNSFPGPKPI